MADALGDFHPKVIAVVMPSLNIDRVSQTRPLSNVPGPPSHDSEYSSRGLQAFNELSRENKQSQNRIPRNSSRDCGACLWLIFASLLNFGTEERCEQYSTVSPNPPRGQTRDRLPGTDAVNRVLVIRPPIRRSPRGRWQLRSRHAIRPEHLVLVSFEQQPGTLNHGDISTPTLFGPRKLPMHASRIRCQRWISIV